MSGERFVRNVIRRIGRPAGRGQPVKLGSKRSEPPLTANWTGAVACTASHPATSLRCRCSRTSAGTSRRTMRFWVVRIRPRHKPARPPEARPGAALGLGDLAAAASRLGHASQVARRPPSDAVGDLECGGNLSTVATSRRPRSIISSVAGSASTMSWNSLTLPIGRHSGSTPYFVTLCHQISLKSPPGTHGRPGPLAGRHRNRDRRSGLSRPGPRMRATYAGRARARTGPPLGEQVRAAGGAPQQRHRYRMDHASLHAGPSYPLVSHRWARRPRRYPPAALVTGARSQQARPRGLPVRSILWTAPG
jgi:hypothetical protein